MLMSEYQDLPLAAGASIFGFVGPIPLFPQVNTPSQVKIQANPSPHVSPGSAQRSFYKLLTCLLYNIFLSRQPGQPILPQHIYTRARVCVMCV
jgi:hypothetical protein